MATTEVSKKETALRVKAVRKAFEAGYRLPGESGSKKGAIAVAADALGMSRVTLSGFLHTRKDIMDEIKSWSKDKKEKEVEITPLEQADKHKHERRAREAQSQLKRALAEITKLNDRIEGLEWSSKVSYKPAEWSYLPKTGKKKSEHIPYLLTSDFQIGEVIEPGAVGGNSFNIEIFRQRYRQLIDSTISLSTDHASASWSYPGIIYARGGDAISGGIHDELERTDELDPFDCVLVCVEEEATGIEELKKAFGKVEVKTVFGNHGRTDFKPPHKHMTQRNHEYLILKMLQERFKKDDNVSFQVTESPDLYFNIYNQRICLTHGDRIGSRGGTGFIGPVATIAKGAKKIIEQQSAVGQRVDRVDMGHFHTFTYGGWYLCNGGMPGYSEYAYSFRMRPEPPMQTLLFHNERHGVVDLRTITLD